MAGATYSNVATEAQRIASLAIAAGKQPWSFGDLQGWQLIEGKTTFVKAGKKYVDNDWKDFMVVEGGLVLGADGVLYGVWHSSGSTSERATWSEYRVTPASPERLAGDSGEPFGKVIQALRRLEAVVS